MGFSLQQVLVWNGLAGGNDEYCAILVALNSILQIVLYAPLAVFFIRVVSHSSSEVVINYQTVAESVAFFLGIPLGLAVVTRFTLRYFTSDDFYKNVFLRIISPFSLIGLLFTIIILFASQGRNVVEQFLSVV